MAIYNISQEGNAVRISKDGSKRDENKGYFGIDNPNLTPILYITREGKVIYDINTDTDIITVNGVLFTGDSDDLEAEINSFFFSASPDGAVTTRETIIFQYSMADQSPTDLNTEQHLNFGNVAPVVTPDLTMAVNGEVTVNNAGQYYLRVFGHFGRTTTSGVSKLIFYGQGDFGGGFVNIGVAKVFMISTADDYEPFEFEVFFTFPAGVKLRYCMVRDGDGNNSGGVHSFVPDFTGAPDLPSIGVDLSKLVTV